MDCRNLDWTTPQDLFLSRDDVSKDDRTFALDVFSKLKKPTMTRERVGNIPRGPTEYLDEMRNICAEFPVYFRYQWPGLDPKPDGNTSMSWIRSDMKVSHVLYPNHEEDEETLEPVDGGEGFLVNCERRFKSKAWMCWEEEYGNDLGDRHRATGQENGKDEIRSVETQDQGLEDKRKQVEDDVGKNSWRWINFPSNNVSKNTPTSVSGYRTNIRIDDMDQGRKESSRNVCQPPVWLANTCQDFIIHNARYNENKQLDGRTWRFFEENIRIHETDSLYSRVRIPHAKGSSFK